MKVIRDAIKARYSFLPFWYTLFYEGEQKGVPPMRPLWVEFPSDKFTFTIDDQYLIGSSLLVRPITEPSQTGTQVYFPGNGEIPVFQRSGSIILRKFRIRRSSSLMVHYPVTLIVCLNKNGMAQGSLYVDDYHTFNYRKGEYLLRDFSFEQNELHSRSGDNFGNFSTKEWIEKIIIIGIKKQPNKLVLYLKGKEETLRWEYISVLQQLIVRKPGVNVGTDFSIKLL